MTKTWTDASHTPITTRKQRIQRLAIVLIIVLGMYLCSSTLGRVLSSAAPYIPRRARCLATAPVKKVQKTFKLPSGDEVPGIALGVWQASPGEVGTAVETALKIGYRHIDGAWIYRPKAGPQEKKPAAPPNKTGITPKLWNTFHAPEDVESALDDSLAKLGTSYVDLYLMHWPVAQRSDGSVNTDLTENPYPTWQAMEKLVEKGKARNIGVSNFNIRRLTNLTSNKLKHIPAVNQVELNFWNPQPELVKWALEHNVILEAYSPLGSNRQVSESLNVPEVKEIAEKLCISPAQVLISWQAQRGNIVLPKSVTPSRIDENLHVFEIPEDLFNKLEKAATSHPPKRVVDPSKGWGVDIFDELDE
ncbi:hypothetical protein EXIGLDRAFT_643065 [Exidia glandulosa HHB12029]|uniref:NADP-dependent oxidoreductase domain-containing protein n=1 Tax=Exidia glandulosa HHB12029 TaxID=1314781 RepID=A0A165KKL6_EXIGL|nr:hypothetical protein EXIGLDRAFT_643065 [Exidia glandulosa HHB12029]